MRKLSIAALVALLVIPAAGSQAAHARRDGGVDLFRFSLTSFLDGSRGDSPTLYFGAGMSMQLGEDLAFAGRGPCRRVERRGRKGWSCRASARGIPVLPTGYYMDPLLQTAHIELSTQGYEHSVDWTGKGEPNISYAGDAGDAVVYAFNNASATGRLFGRRFSTKRDRASSFLGEFLWASARVDNVDFRLGDDGVMHVRAFFPAGS